MSGDGSTLDDHPNVMGHEVRGKTLIILLNINPNPDASDYDIRVMHDIIRRAYKHLKTFDLKDFEFQKIVIN